jgi:NAD(P)-dependent dehydrogenase (short-subunit alcohol dehydrogenase family)
VTGLRLAGRRVLVTGAASGIGLAVVRLFHAEGARLALLDHNAAGLEAVVREIPGTHAEATDVANERQVRRAVAASAAAIGGLDGIVSSAGIDLVRPFATMTGKQWRQVFAVNLDGAVNLCHAALPFLKVAGGGTIVTIASAAALRPLEQRTAYCSAKAALVMFGKTLAIDLAADNIRVNAICPGIIETPLFRSSFEDAADPEAELRKIKDRYVIKRVGRPEEVAYAALYLTSAESAYTTGTAMAVDGGRSFH